MFVLAQDTFARGAYRGGTTCGSTARLRSPRFPSNESRARGCAWRTRKRTSLLVAPCLVNLDAEQGRALVKGLVDAVVGLALVADRGFERPQQADGPAVLASGQIEAPGARSPVKMSMSSVATPSSSSARTVAVTSSSRVEQTGHPVDEREQMAARVGIAIGSGHGLPFDRCRPWPLYTNSQPATNRFLRSDLELPVSRLTDGGGACRSPAIARRSPMAVTSPCPRIVLSIL